MSQTKTVECIESGKDEKSNHRKFPKSVPFILTNVFLERFSSGGVLAILAIYLNQKLLFDADTSTALFHVNEFVLYFFSIIGAVVADTWLGLYKTILLTTLLSAVGTMIITVVSIDIAELPIKALSLVGMFVVAVAAGGVKSNQNVFGGNQFKLPEEEAQLNSYFSMQYFMLKCGLLLGQVNMPILRNDVKCFGSNDCFPLAFGVPALLTIINFLVFWSGKKYYIENEPSESKFVQVCMCCANAIKQKYFNSERLPKEHWLDYAEEKYGVKHVMETKMVIKVSTFFLALPLYWACYGQSNSRWVFQATRMNGDLGWYTIKPDQMIMSTTLFILVQIPLFEQLIYPAMAKVGIKNPLQKMTCGFVLAGLAFIAAAAIEWRVERESIGILWLLPQYCLIAASEVLIWVSSLSFAYTQAPENMKSVITAFIYMTVAGGSLIVIVISGSNIISSQFYEFLFYVGLMTINIVLFVMLARKYKFVDLK